MLENIVADRSLCEKLGEEWGDTVFVWARDANNGKFEIAFREDTERPLMGTNEFPYDKVIPAPIFAEVWAKLPKIIDINGSSYKLCFDNSFDKDEMKAFYSSSGACGYEYIEIPKDIISYKKPVNAALKLYAWCKENGYVKTQEVSNGT